MTIDRKTIRWNGWGAVAAHNPLEGREAGAWAFVAQALNMPSLPDTPALALETLPMPRSRLSGEPMEALAQVLPRARVLTDAYERAFHARGKSYHDLLYLRAGKFDACPDAVVYPETAEEAFNLLRWASHYGVAIVPYGGGSSVVGGVTATGGDVVVAADMTRMNKLLSVDPVSQLATAEGGIYGVQLEPLLQAQGVTLGHYPQSFEFSTLGGWIAARGAGQQSNRYGKAEKWLASAELATPRGLWRTEGFPASAAGPDLNHLIAGSEGTLGLITQATFRVHAKPEVKDYRTYLMPSFEAGAEAIRAIVQAGISVATLRLSDADETHFFQAFAKAGARPGLNDAAQAAALKLMGVGPQPCALIAGHEGERLSVHQGVLAAAKRIKSFGGVAVGSGPAARWYAGRFHGPYLRDPLMDKGVGVDTLETATIWSNIPRLYMTVRKALLDACTEHSGVKGGRGIVMAHISHSYPTGASLYFTFIFPRHLSNDIAQWTAIKRAATNAIAKHGGTLSHHHGVGEDHAPWMMGEKGALGLEILKAVKKTLDPQGVMNPGKMVG
jgi:alkyldihydroxyacetonephosphate synthase